MKFCLVGYMIQHLLMKSMSWSIDPEIDSSSFPCSDSISSLLKMLVMTCTSVSGVGGIEMHLETDLHIFGTVLQSNWVVRMTW
ncbi:hypothetical protein GQ457_12G012610 [Hibiscus cannabinus]